MVRITPKDAQGMMDAYAKVYAPKEESKPETEAKVESESPADVEKTDKQKVFTREKMSKFGDLIAGITPETVVEAPAPVVEEEVSAPVDFSAMSKDELEDYGRTVGIELDRRHNKKKLIKELEDHLATS